MRLRIFPILLIAVSLPGSAASTLQDLPDWAQSAVNAAASVPAPAAADAWILYLGIGVSYHGNGELRLRERRIVRVLSAMGESESTFMAQGTGPSAGLRRLRGWNLRPDGVMTKVDKGDLIGIDPDKGDQVSLEVLRTVALRGVVKGSLVAYESEYEWHSRLGPCLALELLKPYPVHKFELGPRTDGLFFSIHRNLPMTFVTNNFSPWLPESTETKELHLSDLPPIPKDEQGMPPRQKWVPRVQIQVQDPGLKDMPQPGSWNSLSIWYAGQFDKCTALPWPLPAPPGSPLDILKQADRWRQQSFRYQQVYLSPDRSWIPAAAAETARRHYGDCKDLSAVFLAAVKAAGLQGFPALNRIGSSPISAEEPPSPAAFNHVIVAIRLNQSLGLATEVETPAGRFLLLDPTDPFTPFGFLGKAHRHNRVMICTPQGAVWVAVPDRSLAPQSIHLAFRGDMSGQGARGTLTVTEHGNQEFLRSYAAQASPRQLRDRVASLLTLAPDASLTITRQSDPMDRGHPMVVECHIEVSKPLRRLGNEFELMDFGFPEVPPPIQPRNKIRTLPVEMQGGRSWRLTVDLGLGEDGMGPAQTSGHLETPFRKIQWTSRVEHSHLHLELEQETRTACWDFAHREAGVAAQRQDRARMKSILDDARTLISRP